MSGQWTAVTPGRVDPRRLDMHSLTGWLALGAAVETEEQMRALVRFGVTHVLDCRTPRTTPPLAARCPAVRWRSAPTEDDGGPRGVGWYRACLAAASGVDAERHLLYVHCAHGVNRGPAAAYAILRARGWAAADAERLILERRPVARSTYFRDADACVPHLCADGHTRGAR